MPALPKVSCLTVTAGRRNLFRRALLCFRRQSYPNRELVVVDDGAEDLSELLAELPADQVQYVRLEKRPENVLGRLRNIALDAARGELVAQWDDDDWYHEERIARQAEVLASGYDACTLHGAIMHLDTPEFFDHPYVGYLAGGVPGSIMHRRDAAIRYPEMRRAEDTVFLRAWQEKRYAKLPPSDVHLFIRCFHGRNTWEQAHFLTRMRNTLPDALRFAWYRYVRRDLFRHPRFHLDPAARRAFETYLDDSRRLGLFEVQSSRFKVQGYSDQP